MNNAYNVQQGNTTNFLRLIYKLQLQMQKIYKTVNRTLEGTKGLPPTGLVLFSLSLSQDNSFHYAKTLNLAQLQNPLNDSFLLLMP
jgi:hypothetical protein